MQTFSGVTSQVDAAAGLVNTAEVCAQTTRLCQNWSMLEKRIEKWEEENRWLWEKCDTLQGRLMYQNLETFYKPCSLKQISALMTKKVSS